MARRILTHILLPLSLFAGFPAAASTPETPGANGLELADLSATMGSILESTLRRSGARGVSAAVVLPDGRVVAVADGYADSESRSRMTTRTRFLGASTGKTYVAAIVMSLVEEGALDLDRPIAYWLGNQPWFERLPNHQDITLRMLLNHSSGIPDHIYQPAFQWGTAFQLRRDREDYFHPVQCVEFILDKPPRAPAGESYGYTDTAYILAGLIIEQATGRKYYDLLRERILEPLKLGGVTPSNRRYIPRLAPGYVRGDLINYIAGVTGKNMDEDGLLNRNPAREWTGGGLATKPADLARFYAALFRGNVLSRPSVEEMITSTVRVPSPHDQRYGLGVFVIRNEEFGTYLHHSGWTPGYVTNVIYYQDYDLAVALQMNQDYNYDIYEPVKDIARAVIASVGGWK